MIKSYEPFRTVELLFCQHKRHSSVENCTPLSHAAGPLVQAARSPMNMLESHRHHTEAGRLATRTVLEWLWGDSGGGSERQGTSVAKGGVSQGQHGMPAPFIFLHALSLSLDLHQQNSCCRYRGIHRLPIRR